MADDSDIKIYIGKTNGESTEFENLSENIRHHVSSGNRDKAVRLGEVMAKTRPDDKVLGFDISSFSASELYQMRVLLTFTAEYSVQKLIEDTFLADTVSSAMYDYLKANEKGYYDNISDGGAFTFYLLALKKDGDTAENMGEQFAVFCGINKPEMIRFGADLFTVSLSYFTQLIDGETFQK